jgi:hypothetical protein
MIEFEVGDRVKINRLGLTKKPTLHKHKGVVRYDKSMVREGNVYTVVGFPKRTIVRIRDENLQIDFDYNERFLGRCEENKFQKYVDEFAPMSSSGNPATWYLKDKMNLLWDIVDKEGGWLNVYQDLIYIIIKRSKGDSVVQPVMQKVEDIANMIPDDFVDNFLEY